MTPEQAAALRAPFPPEKVGKLPKVTCGACRDSRERHCDKHAKSRCGECGAWITSAHMHVDYVGHADATDRFLEVDPEWNWEPFALDGRGLPMVDDNGGMWIRLTIAGTTRIGYGHADGKRGGDAVKEAIGDALRNAGLRFGVALDLWRKEPPVDESAHRGRRAEAPIDPTPEQTVRQDAFAAAITSADDETQLRAVWGQVGAAVDAGGITATQAAELSRQVKRRRAELADPPPKGITKRTNGRLFALFGELGYDGDENRQQRREIASKVLEREVASLATLSEDEGLVLVAALEKRKKEAAK